MKTSMRIVLLSILSVVLAYALNAHAADSDSCDKNWLNISDAEFAQSCGNKAFSSSLADQQEFAWKAFARINKVNSDNVPAWDSWPSDDDTFKDSPANCNSDSTIRRTAPPVVAEKEDLAKGPHGKQLLGAQVISSEIAIRNCDAFNYIAHETKTNNLEGLTQYLKNNKGKHLSLPVGSIEMKGKFCKENSCSDETKSNAFPVTYGGETYYYQGMHLAYKVKMLPENANPYKSEDKSWFWATFEFNGNPGFDHVRDTLITYPGSSKGIQGNPGLDKAVRDKILKEAGLPTTLKNYSLMGTQYQFNNDKDQPVILGNTMMEDFAGGTNDSNVGEVPNPADWTVFNSSCHTCHGSVSAYLNGNDQAQINTAVFSQFGNKTLIGQMQVGEHPDWVSLDFVWAYLNAK